MRIKFIKVDNGFVIVRRVLRRGRGSVKVRERFVEGKRYRVKM